MSEENMSLTADRPSRAKLVATLAMIASAACWGFATVMSRNLLDAMPPTTLLVIQLTASVAALLVMAAPNFPHRYEGKGIGRAAAIGLLEPGLTYAVGLAGLSLTTAGKASVISASEPVLIVLMSWILFSQRPSRRLLVCIALAVVGVLMVSGVGDLDAGDSERLGDGLIVLATLFAATYVVLSARVAGDFPPATLASSQQLVGLAFALALYAVERLATADPVSITDMPPRVIVYAALSGVVQYAAAFWLYLIGLRHLSAGAAGLWLTLVPVFGLFGAYVWLGEVPTIIMLLGASFILAAVLAGRSES